MSEERTMGRWSVEICEWMEPLTHEKRLSRNSQTLPKPKAPYIHIYIYIYIYIYIERERERERERKWVSD